MVLREHRQTAGGHRQRCAVLQPLEMPLEHLRASKLRITGAMGLRIEQAERVSDARGQIEQQGDGRQLQQMGIGRNIHLLRITHACPRLFLDAAIHAHPPAFNVLLRHAARTTLLLHHPLGQTLPIRFLRRFSTTCLLIRHATTFKPSASAGQGVDYSLPGRKVMERSR
ncbi:hypothetical protein SDC9_187101 [bioreactor metagenome]|uniref:Uncharacterized protein n=1 Tax=bioreactor metagenome TaxID=1076179 RepID=A0A645HW48_9ZZZZ